MFTHHVFFWLREDLSAEESARFYDSVSTLLTIDCVEKGILGKPAPTDRPVIERSYSYSLLLMFKSQAEHDIYQPHPTHQKFVATCKDLWSRVLIFDSIDA